jgi:4-aminobutyrate aminotransferase
MLKRQWIEQALGPKSAALVQRDAATFFHQEGSTPCLSALSGIEGPWLEDLDGRRYFDLHGNTVHHLGHAHPRLLAALKAQIDDLPFSPRRYTNETAVRLAEKLVRLWPGGRAKVLLATGGSDAIEIAMRLALVSTGRRGFVSLEGSYHGHGFGALGLSSAGIDPKLALLGPDRHHVTPYWDKSRGGPERMVDDIVKAFASASGGIAAIVAEPIRANCHVPPAWLWPAVCDLCTRHGAKLIFDEIPTGLGKTGKFFAFSHFGVVPDAVVLGKALGGGVLPIAAVLADAGMDVAPELNLGHYTHEKNPLTTRAALTTIEIIEEEGLVERAARLGERAAVAFAALGARCQHVSGYRGKGLLGAVELSDPSLAEPALWSCLRNGISTVTKAGALGFSPPLVIGDADIDWLVQKIEEALGAIPA